MKCRFMESLRIRRPWYPLVENPDEWGSLNWVILTINPGVWASPPTLFMESLHSKCPEQRFGKNWGQEFPVLLNSGMTKKRGTILRSAVHRELIRFLDCGTRRFEPASRNGSEDETSNMRQVGHAAGLHLRHLTCAHQLNQ